MKYKGILWIPLLPFLLTSFVLPAHFDDANEQKKWIVGQNSNLRVNGSTNINNFSCEIPAYDKTDTITVNRGKNDKDVILSGCISLNVQVFDCHNPIMTHDLRKTLKADKFPMLHIYFLSLNKFPQLSSRPDMITGLVDIEIAGVRKRFNVNYQVTQDPQKTIHLLGSRDVNFSDFSLVPPRKLGGMIKTHDKLSVDFHLKIKSID